MNQEDGDLIELIAACRGEDLEPDRREQLLSRLRGDEAFQQAFVDEIRMLGMLKAVQSTEPRWLRLQDVLGWGSTEGIGKEDREEEFMRRIGGLSPRRVPRSWKWWLVAAAAAVLVAGLTLRLRPRGPREIPVASRPPHQGAPALVPDNVAMIVKLEGVRWEPEDGPPAGEGVVLKPGRLRMRSGRASLAFFNGVTMTVEGPADLDLIAIDRVFCRRGKLRARVPKGAEGFVVATVDSAVIDQGTEFALNVGADGKSRVLVFEGTAEAALLDLAGAAKQGQIIKRSEAYEIDPRAGRITGISAKPGSFVSAHAGAAPSLVLEPGYAEAVMRSRPRGYWRFESLEAAGVPDEVPGGPPLRVSGPVALAGDGVGNGCVVFRPGAPEQFLTADTPWELPRTPGHAVEFWFLAEGISYSSLVGLFPPTEFVPAGQDSPYVHTFLVEQTATGRRLHKPASIRFLHRWPIDIKVVFNVYSGSVYIPRRWQHVVAQKNGDRMELYFDGVPSPPLTLDPDHATLSCQLVVGRRTPNAQDTSDIRPFIGRLDELALYDHPLSAEEIHRHFSLARQEDVPE